LATAHSAIGKPEIALQYLTDAIASLDTIQYDRMMGVAKARLAEVYVQLDDYKSALTTCDDGINLLSNLSRSNQTGLPSLFRTKGKLMELEGRDETALAFYLKSLKQAERINRDFELMRANVAVGKFYTSKAPKKGKVYCELALALAKKNNSTSVEMDACECLFNIYKEEQSYKDALKYFQRRVGLIDSLGTLKVEHALDLNSKIALKDKQIAEQAHQKEIKNQELQNQRRLNSTLFIASIIGFLLLGILSRLNKKNRKQNIEITNQNAEIIKKTNELEKANLSLESSNDELESFAHMASHDLKAPLTTITSFSELLQKKASSKLDTKELEFLNFITSSGRNLSAMIDDILSYSKVGSQKVIIKETDMNSIIDVLLITLNPQAKEKSVTLTQLSTFPNAMVDEVKMKRVFQNIASNAIKFCDVKKDTRYIDFSYKELTDFHQFTIADNGIGIPDTKKNLFEPFTYLNPKSEYKGTGMGLAMCEKIIKKHGGKIWYESELGKGTAFHFTVNK